MCRDISLLFAHRLMHCFCVDTSCCGSCDSV